MPVGTRIHVPSFNAYNPSFNSLRCCFELTIHHLLIIIIINKLVDMDPDWGKKQHKNKRLKEQFNSFESGGLYLLLQKEPAC